jgi:hypothetical protein
LCTLPRLFWAFYRLDKLQKRSCAFVYISALKSLGVLLTARTSVTLDPVRMAALNVSSLERFGASGKLAFASYYTHTRTYLCIRLVYKFRQLNKFCETLCL